MVVRQGPKSAKISSTLVATIVRSMMSHSAIYNTKSFMLTISIRGFGLTTPDWKTARIIEGCEEYDP